MSDIDDDCCACHIAAPCFFCTSLDEEEYEAYSSGGRDALHKLRATREDRRIADEAELDRLIAEERAADADDFHDKLTPDDAAPTA